MSDPHLKIAIDFIREKDFDAAKKVLRKIPHDPNAQALLAQIERDEQAQPSQPTQPVKVGISLPPRLEVILRDYLRPQEIVLWHEQPEPSIFTGYLYPDRFKRLQPVLGIFMFLVALLPLSYAPQRFSALNLLQLFTSILLIASPFIWDSIYRRRAGTIDYVLTDQQGYIIEKFKVTSIEPYYKAEMRVVPEKAGFRSVIFRTNNNKWGWIRLPLGFLGIAKSDEVYRLVNQYWKP